MQNKMRSRKMTPVCIIVLKVSKPESNALKRSGHQVEFAVANVLVLWFYVIEFLLLWGIHPCATSDACYCTNTPCSANRCPRAMQLFKTTLANRSSDGCWAAVDLAESASVPSFRERFLVIHSSAWTPTRGINACLMEVNPESCAPSGSSHLRRQRRFNGEDQWEGQQVASDCRCPRWQVKIPVSLCLQPTSCLNIDRPSERLIRHRQR